MAAAANHMKTAEEWSEFTIPQLKAICDERKIAPSAKRPKKADWIDTLMAADKAATKPVTAAAAAPAPALAAAPKPIASTPVKPALKDITNQPIATAAPAAAAAAVTTKPKSNNKSHSLAPAPTPAPTPIKPSQSVVSSVAPTPLTKLVQQLSKPLYPELGGARETEIHMKWDIDQLIEQTGPAAPAPAAAVQQPAIVAVPTGQRVKFIYGRTGQLVATQHLPSVTTPLTAADAANKDESADGDALDLGANENESAAATAADADGDDLNAPIERMAGTYGKADGFLPAGALSATATTGKSKPIF